MKILYGIQGTGNGHITRAMEILPALQKRGKVDVLISGTQNELPLPVALTFRCQGLGFVFGKKGGIDYVGTYKKSRLKSFYAEVKSLDVERYDIVISDFEPVTAWASMLKRKRCLGISNQAALLSPNVPKAPVQDLMGRFVIRNYAPCSAYLAFSYERYDDRIYTPIIRSSLRQATLRDDGHITVYLPAYDDDKIVHALRQVVQADFVVFSKRAKVPMRFGNVQIRPLDKEGFEQSVTSAAGIITAAGFGTTTEALFMGKKMLVIPQKNQYEQACNAMALSGMGVTVLKSLKQKHIASIQQWVNEGTAVHRDYPDITEALINDVIYWHHTDGDAYNDYLTAGQYLLKQA